MKKKKRKVARFTKGEKLLYALAILCLCSTFVLKIFVSASTSDLKIKIRTSINNNEYLNDTLQLQLITMILTT